MNRYAVPLIALALMLPGCSKKADSQDLLMVTAAVNARLNELAAKIAILETDKSDLEDTVEELQDRVEELEAARP